MLRFAITMYNIISYPILQKYYTESLDPFCNLTKLSTSGRTEEKDLLNSINRDLFSIRRFLQTDQHVFLQRMSSSLSFLLFTASSTLCFVTFLADIFRHSGKI